MINEVRICNEGRWAAKHLDSLITAYGHAPFLKDHIEFIKEIFSGKIQDLVDLNLRIIRHLIRHLRIDTELVLLSSLGLKSKGEQLLVDICRAIGADCIRVQRPAAKFMDQDLFKSENIFLEFIRIPSPVYPQLWGEFIPNLSAFDLVLNCGPESHRILFQ